MLISGLGWNFRAILLAAVMLAFPESARGQPEAGGREVLQVFVREGCPRCADAKAYLEEFSGRYPELEILYRDVGADSSALEELIRLSEAVGQEPGVPVFAFEGRLIIGFISPEMTGPYLTALIERREITQGTVETGVFGTLSIDRLGLPLFTLAIGLLDGFNPCAMWVLLFLLSMLVHLRDRKRMALIAGIFVLVSGAVYYAFMAAWLNFFMLVGMSLGLRIALSFVAVAVGLVNIRDFLVPAGGYTLSIPESAKPGIYARVRQIIQADTLLLSLVGVATLAVLVNFLELLCTAGFPAMYTAILTRQGLDPVAYYAYLGLYILGYMADDSAMVAVAVLALSSNRLTARGGRFLKLVSGVVMLALGLVLFMKPGWLY